MDDFRQLLRLGFFYSAATQAERLIGTLGGATPSRVALTFLCVTKIDGEWTNAPDLPAVFEKAMREGRIDDPGIRAEMRDVISRMASQAHAGPTSAERGVQEPLERCYARVFGNGEDHEHIA